MIYWYINKKYYTIYIKKKGKMWNYEDLLPKYTINDNKLFSLLY